MNNFTENATDQDRALQKALEILTDENGKEKYGVMRNALLSNCIDTTQLMVDEVLKRDRIPSPATVLAS